MTTRYQLKRSTVSGVVPTTGDIQSGELAVNLADRKLFTANATAVFELGSNLASLSVTGEATFNANIVISNTGMLVFAANAGIFANGSLGSAGQVLASNATGLYWSTAGGDVTTSGTQTLTNKRIDPRVSSEASASSVTPDISSFDMYSYTALATGLTINATTGGTPVNGSKLVFRFKDDGTSRALTWTTSGANSFRVIGVTLPTTTTINKLTYVGCIYNSNESFWDVIAVTTQA